MVLAHQCDDARRAEATGDSRRVLLFCIDRNNNCGARLPKVLKAAGFHVSALSPPLGLLTKTRYLDRHMQLPNGRHAPSMLASLERAYREFAPDIIVPVD